MTAWTTPANIAAKVRRRWDDGSLLSAYAEGAPFARMDVPIRGPRASEIGEDLAAVREWIADLDAGRRSDTRYSLAWAPIGGRNIGRNDIPARAVIASYAQAWALLRVESAVRRFDAVLAVAADQPRVRSWALRHPHRALELADDMPGVCSAFAWLDTHRGSQLYLRQISAPGVDTKFAERHRGVLAAMLEVPSTSTGFLAGLGLRSKPDLVRVRPAPSLGLPSPLTEMAVRDSDIANLPVHPRSALVIENEITYLSVPVPHDGIVIWGRGFAVGQFRSVPWLNETPIDYWGDIDTHGFAILNRIRTAFPQVRSLLMDRSTLLAHRERWTAEERPTRAELPHLSSDESALYDELVNDALGPRVRLEQERIDWAWVQNHLTE